MGYNKKKDKKAVRKRQSHKTHYKNLKKTTRDPSNRAATMNSSLDVAKQNRSNPNANIVLSGKKLRLYRKRLAKVELAKSQMDIEVGSSSNKSLQKGNQLVKEHQMEIDNN
ncbi:hypothetical protein TrispH2_007893 [Trichoplax sp. H2]|nr:hypothetical protein TrispH2_007893 [Trichoplax sp. H2]|eukprot:RDD38661.1 hypothetical protein TrispH2_007893 [Trichoplax sp. H2]